MNNPVVRKLEQFGPLDDDDRGLLNKLVAEDREVPSRIRIIGEGTKPSTVHLMTSGFACRYKTLSNGKRQIVALLLPGDFCDVNAFMLQSMDHSIATLATSRVAEASKATIFEMLESPTLGKAMFMASLVDCATLREWVANVGSRNAEDRIAHLLCEIYARLQAVGLASDDAFSFPLNQAELGQCVGLSLVHTNKSLKTLKDRNLLSCRGGRVAIVDPLGLQALCGFTQNYLHLGETSRTVPTTQRPSDSHLSHRAVLVGPAA